MRSGTSADQITYEYFCVLGGLAKGKCFKILRHNGSYNYFTYHLRNRKA